MVLTSGFLNVLDNRDNIQQQIEVANQSTSTYVANQSAQLTGDPSQELNNLERLYLSAKNNLSYAPFEFEEAKQRYFTYKYGENGYKEMVREELIAIANTKVDKIIEVFNLSYNDILHKIQKIEKLETYLQPLSSSYKENFDIIDANLTSVQQQQVFDELHGSVLVNTRKSYYELMEYTKEMNYYSYYVRIYYILFILLFFLFIKKTNISYIKKFILLVIIGCYPLYIHSMFLGINALCLGLYNNLPGNIFLQF